MTLDDDTQFSYRPDPVISDVQPLNHLYVYVCLPHIYDDISVM